MRVLHSLSGHRAPSAVKWPLGSPCYAHCHYTMLQHLGLEQTCLAPQIQSQSGSRQIDRGSRRGVGAGAVVEAAAAVPCRAQGDSTLLCMKPNYHRRNPWMRTSQPKMNFASGLLCVPMILGRFANGECMLSFGLWNGKTLGHGDSWFPHQP